MYYVIPCRSFQIWYVLPCILSMIPWNSGLFFIITFTYNGIYCPLYKICYVWPCYVFSIISWNSELNLVQWADISSFWVDTFLSWSDCSILLVVLVTWRKNKIFTLLHYWFVTFGWLNNMSLAGHRFVRRQVNNDIQPMSL